MIPVASPSPSSKLALSVAPAEPRPNFGGPPRAAEAEVRALLQTAADNGITRVVTRPAGDAERQLGQCWPFPSPFQVSVRTVPVAEGIDRVEARARRSLERMGLPRGDLLIVSSADDLAGAEGRALWDRLLSLRDRGLYRRLGLRLTMDDGPALMARRFLPDVVEMDVNLLDQRAARSGVLAEIAGLGCDVQASAVFARGQMFGPREGLNDHHSYSPLSLSRLRRRLAEARLDPMQAALAYVMGRCEVSTVLVGARSAAELRAVVAAGACPAADLDWSDFAVDEALPPAARISSAA